MSILKLIWRGIIFVPICAFCGAVLVLCLLHCAITGEDF